MIEVRFYPPDSMEDHRLKYAVIMASYDGKWIFCRHKSRTTWEIPGGHREANETIEQAARRELWEETGVSDAKLQPVSVYGVYDGTCETFGMLFYAEAEQLSTLDQHYEIAEIVLSDTLPDKLTYPLIQPHLFDHVVHQNKTVRRKMLVVPYDANWKTQFEAIKNTLESVFSEIQTDIIHFGSTSIEGMCAKPIIDVMVLVDNISSVDLHTEQMSAIGYIPKGEHGIKGRRYFQKLASDGVNHTEHIHCYEKTNPLAQNQLMFCRYLSVDRDAFDAYRSVKLEAAKQFSENPEGYANYKADCISTIMQKAKSYFTK